MRKKERQAFILQQVNLHNKFLSASPSGGMNVLKDTVRSDVQELADEDKVITVNGVASLYSFNDTGGDTADLIQAPDCKNVIAQKAVDLIIQICNRG